MNTLSDIDAVPAHMPANTDEAVLSAKIIAFNAASHARYCAQHTSADFNYHLSHLDVLVRLGMIDKAYADAITAEVKASFDAALTKLYRQTPDPA